MADTMEQKKIKVKKKTKDRAATSDNRVQMMMKSETADTYAKTRLAPKKEAEAGDDAMHENVYVDPEAYATPSPPPSEPDAQPTDADLSPIAPSSAPVFACPVSEADFERHLDEVRTIADRIIQSFQPISFFDACGPITKDADDDMNMKSWYAWFVA